MNIRPAKLEDLQQIQDLNHGLFLFEEQFTGSYDVHWPYSETGEKYFRERIEKNKGIVFTAEIENEIVGYICGYFSELPYRNRQLTAEIDNMFVRENNRNQGVDSKLVKSFEHVAKKKGAVRIKVTSKAANRAAINFYRSNGYEHVKTTLEKVYK